MVHTACGGAGSSPGRSVLTLVPEKMPDAIQAFYNLHNIKLYQ